MTNQIDQPNPSIDPAAEYRKLPAVDALLRVPALAWLLVVSKHHTASNVIIRGL
jgi:hypothetical protein